MKIESRLDRRTASGSVEGIVERRTTVPILGHVLIEPNGNSLALSATDLEVGIRTQVSCRSGKDKSITLHARKLFEIVREAEGEIVALNTLDNDWVELKCGRAKFKMMGLDPRSFPAMPSQSTAKEGAAQSRKPLKAELKISAAVLAGMIDKTIFAVSPDEARYNLSGVYIESQAAGAARMVATDGHRPAMIERAAPGLHDGRRARSYRRKGSQELRKPLDAEGELGGRAHARRAARAPEARKHGVSMRLHRGGISRSTGALILEAIQAPGDRRPRHPAVRGDQARGDFFERALSRRQVRVVGRAP